MCAKGGSHTVAYLPLAREPAMAAQQQLAELAKYQALAQQNANGNLYLELLCRPPRIPEPAPKPEPSDPAAARFSKLQLD
jgi:hypothetical protein